ncbi:MAG: ASKHA domain-containing protein [Pseudomonadota bacterium]
MEADFATSEQVQINDEDTLGTTHQVVFTPSGLSKSAADDTTLLSAAQDAGVSIRSLCGGNGNCRQCWIRVIEGSHPKHGLEVSGDHVTPPTELEERYRTKIERFADMRLACRTHIRGDLLIDVPESSQEHLTNISKSNAARDFSVRPSTRLMSFALAEATMDDNPSASENMLERLSERGIDARINYHVLSGIQKTIQESKANLTIALRDEQEVVAVYPMADHRIIGAAVDIGSTTLAVYVHDLTTGELLWEDSAMNPQIKFGEDLMSRVSYVMMNKGGDQQMTQAVHEKLTSMFHAACKAIEVELDKLVEIVLVGNPIMHHLFFGISPVELGQAPFTVANRDWLEVQAHDLKLDLHPTTRIAFLPLIAGHVGADTAAAYLSEIDTMQSETSLLVDIGTNAEIMLAKDGQVYATSSPTGPAFEGAEISSGVRASHGAIERVRIDPETLAVRYKIIGVDAWSDEPEFAEAGQRAIGICGSGIIEVMVCLAQAGLIDKGGLFVQSKAPELFDQNGKTVRFMLVDQGEYSIYVEQTDVRSIQLAKAALFAGVQLLMDYQQCQQFDSVLLAGAFGAHLDPEYVADLDLIPGAQKNQIRSVGNAAGVGATKALLDVREREKIKQEVRQVVKIESANEPNFQEYFVDGMKFSVSPVAGQQNQRNRRRRR